MGSRESCIPTPQKRKGINMRRRQPIAMAGTSSGGKKTAPSFSWVHFHQSKCQGRRITSRPIDLSWVCRRIYSRASSVFQTNTSSMLVDKVIITSAIMNPRCQVLDCRVTNTTGHPCLCLTRIRQGTGIKTSSLILKNHQMFREELHSQAHWRKAVSKTSWAILKCYL